MGKIFKIIKENIILTITFIIIMCFVLAWTTVRYFGYSTPITASNEKEKARFEKRAKERENEKQILKDIE